MREKTCGICGGSEFYKDGRCKPCTRKKVMKYSKDPVVRERKRLASAEWYERNKVAALAYATKKRSENPGLNSSYHAANKDKINARKAAYRAENIDKERSRERIKNHNRRAAQKGKLSADISDRLLILQRGKCACGCQQPLGDDYHLDHIMPLALGGTNTDDNIQLLRQPCNNQKYAKHPVDFMQSRGFLL